MARAAFQQITDLSSSTALTVPAGALSARCQAAAQNVRVRLDGDATAPTSTVGELLTAGGDVFVINDPILLTTARFIEAAGGARLDVHYRISDADA